MEKKFITVKEACKLYSLSRTSIYKLRKLNLIKWYNPTPKKVLILKSSIDDYYESTANEVEFNNNGF